MRIPALILIGAFAAGLPAAQAAETVCKGLTTDPCKANSGCSWVKAHKIKSGKEVAGFCRKKAVRQSTTPKTPKTQAKSG